MDSVWYAQEHHIMPSAGSVALPYIFWLILEPGFSARQTCSDTPKLRLDVASGNGLTPSLPRQERWSYGKCLSDNQSLHCSRLAFADIALRHKKVASIPTTFPVR